MTNGFLARRATMLLLLMLLTLTSCARSLKAPTELQGDFRVHGPGMIKQGETYYVFSIGDEGLVIRSRPSYTWNAIDPNLSFDADGTPWLSLGSFWTGIKMQRIEPSTGKLSATDTALYSLASSGGGPIEAPAIIHRNGYYYLFVSFDICCRGANSTYKIMVSRSTSITGPFVDSSGKPMDQGGVPCSWTAKTATTALEARRSISITAPTGWCITTTTRLTTERPSSRFTIWRGHPRAGRPSRSGSMPSR